MHPGSQGCNTVIQCCLSCVSSWQGYPSIKFAGTQLYSWMKRGTVRVKCLAQEHNTMSPTGPKPGPRAPESSTLTMRPPCLRLKSCHHKKCTLYKNRQQSELKSEMIFDKTSTQFSFAVLNVYCLSSINTIIITIIHVYSAFKSFLTYSPLQLSPFQLIPFNTDLGC